MLRNSKLMFASGVACLLAVTNGAWGFPPLGLSAAEEADLLHMREEEKLARDVYLAMFELWEAPVFENISASEQNHMDALATLLARYGLADPVVDDTPGAFTDPVFTELYATLITAGSTSALDAYMVGALIEELDIVDLREALARTHHADIERVYENLSRGSRNHLRAFAALISAAGATYEAQYLTQEEFDAIANSPKETGRKPRGQQRQCVVAGPGSASGAP